MHPLRLRHYSHGCSWLPVIGRDANWIISGPSKECAAQLLEHRPIDSSSGGGGYIFRALT
jgi:hypothetical protein